MGRTHSDLFKVNIYIVQKLPRDNMSAICWQNYQLIMKHFERRLILKEAGMPQRVQPAIKLLKAVASLVNHGRLVAHETTFQSELSGHVGLRG